MNTPEVIDVRTPQEQLTEAATRLARLVAYIDAKKREVDELRQPYRRAEIELQNHMNDYSKTLKAISDLSEKLRLK